MNWIGILKCPLTGLDLRILTEEEVMLLKADATAHKLWQADGSVMNQTLEQGLISSDQSYIYPIINGIIILLKDLALTRSADKFIKAEKDKDKQLVQNFYNQKG
ncbi:MAG: hypothetical protein Q7U83_17005, partial [Daejeonella sp.]|nr:hypothetical protein [Daejeonella sp.]